MARLIRLNFITFCGVMLLSACGFMGVEGDEYVTEVSNEGLTLELVFMGDVLGEPWNEDLIEPYIAASERWLEVIEGVEGGEHHILTIFIEVRPLRGGLGAASPEEITQIGPHVIPISGLIEISEFTYSEDFLEEYGREADDEFDANILHEMGHVFGIGSLWNLSMEDGEIFSDDRSPNYREWALESDENEGPIYIGEAGTQAYNTVFGTDFGFMPVLAPTMDHVYSLVDGNEPRISANGQAIPSAQEELMADGRRLSIITVGLLEDLGWQVNPEAADPY